MKHRCQIGNLKICVNLDKPKFYRIVKGRDLIILVNAQDWLPQVSASVLPHISPGRKPSQFTYFYKNLLAPKYLLSLEPLGGFGDSFIGEGSFTLFSIFLYSSSLSAETIEERKKNTKVEKNGTLEEETRTWVNQWKKAESLPWKCMEERLLVQTFLAGTSKGKYVIDGLT